MKPWLAERLVCPRDHEALILEGRFFTCVRQHRYPLVDDVPVMLLDDAAPTHGVCSDTLHHAANPARDVDVAAGGHGCPATIDAFVQREVAATNGYLYRPLVGRLSRYPVPQLRLPNATGSVLLDLGCNWGRWCISAVQKGYRPIGIDPSLDAIQSAKRVIHQLGGDVEYLVADGRHIPLVTASVDVVFSYSVLQHFSKPNVLASLREVSRVLKPSGICMIQMPNAFGVRSLYHQLKRGFRDARKFEVRYWRPKELRQVFERSIGPAVITADGYFGLGIQPSDIDILPSRFRAIVRCSEALRRISETISPMKWVADSVYVTCVRTEGSNL